MYARLLSFCFAALVALPAVAAVKVETAKVEGQEVWYAANPSVPVVDVLLSFENAGSASDPAGKEGRADFAAEMLSEGAGGLDALAFRRALNDKAITLEARVYADRTVIHVHALKEAAPRAGELLALMLSKPKLDDESMARVRTRLQTELAQLAEEPSYVAARAFDAAAFAGHPYAASPDGTPASLAAMKVQDLHDFLGAYFGRANLLVAAAGDLDGDTLDALLRPTLAALPAAAPAALPPAKVTMLGVGQSLAVAKDVPQSVVVFGTPAPARDDPQFYTAYLLNQIIGGSPLTSLLGEVVRQQKGLVYNIGTDLDVRGGATLLRGELATRAETAPQATRATMQTLVDLHDKGATNEQCEEARTYVLGAFPRELDGSQSVAGTLLMMRIYHLGADYIARRADYFNAVRCEDINALAATLLDPKKFLTVTVGRTGEAAEGANP